MTDNEMAQAELVELKDGTAETVQNCVKQALAGGLALQDVYLVVSGEKAKAEWEVLVVTRSDIEHLGTRAGYSGLLAKKHEEGAVRVLYKTPKMFALGYVIIGPPMVRGGDA